MIDPDRAQEILCELHDARASRSRSTTSAPGYSSLSRLREMPVGPEDRPFVRERVDQDPQAAIDRDRVPRAREGARDDDARRGHRDPRGARLPARARLPDWVRATTSRSPCRPRRSSRTRSAASRRRPRSAAARLTSAASVAARRRSTIDASSMPAHARSSAGAPEPGISVTPSFTTRPRERPGRRERIQDRVADAAFDPVVLDDDDRRRVSSSARRQRRRVDRLHAVAVDDARRDRRRRRGLRGAQAPVERDAGADQRDASSWSPDASVLRAPDRELLVRRRRARASPRAWSAGTRCRAGRTSRPRARTVAFPSAGYSTVEPWSARNIARSSSAICDGPSSPIETPACEPQSRRSARPIDPHPDWSYARVSGTRRTSRRTPILPSACMPDLRRRPCVCSAM